MTDDHRVIYHPHVVEERKNGFRSLMIGVDPFFGSKSSDFLLFEKYGRSKIDVVCSKFKASDQKFS